MSLLGNIIWFILGGWISGLSWLISGLIWCITIVGIPYGLQCFKFATLAASPFGLDALYEEEPQNDCRVRLVSSVYPSKEV